MHAESATGTCGLLPYTCGLMSSWAFVLGDSVLGDFVLGAFVWIPLDQNIWQSSITLETKLRLYNTCILPLFLYGAETWSVTVMLSKKIDALDNWCLRRILNVHWSEFVTNDEIRSRTGQPLLSDTVRSRRLSFFGHLHRTDPSQDHYRALQACIMGPPDDWRRRIGRPRQSWLRTVEADLRPMNLGLATSKRRAQDRSAWRKLVTTATSTSGSEAPEERETRD